MFGALLLVVMTQVMPCGPTELSPPCYCKQGVVSACEALVGDDARKAAQVLDEVVEALEALEALEQASRMAGEGDETKKAGLREAERVLSQALGDTEPPNCKGQEHHPISRRIARQLAIHPTLKGLYKPRDPRFVTRAKDEQSHCGYQEWHRKVDEEVVQWLKTYPKATARQFMDKLREIYNRPGMRERFPNGF